MHRAPHRAQACPPPPPRARARARAAPLVARRVHRQRADARARERAADRVQVLPQLLLAEVRAVRGLAQQRGALQVLRGRRRPWVRAAPAARAGVLQPTRNVRAGAPRAPGAGPPAAGVRKRSFPRPKLSPARPPGAASCRRARARSRGPGRVLDPTSVPPLPATRAAPPASGTHGPASACRAWREAGRAPAPWPRPRRGCNAWGAAADAHWRGAAPRKQRPPVSAPPELKWPATRAAASTGPGWGGNCVSLAKDRTPARSS